MDFIHAEVNLSLEKYEAKLANGEINNKLTFYDS